MTNKTFVSEKIESLKGQIEYMREIGCNKLANLLVNDLKELERNDPVATVETGYIAGDYSWEAVQKARAKYGKK